MSTNTFFKQQFQLRNFLLRHDVTSDFYLGCFQRNRSAIPLLVVRAIVCVWCVCIVIAWIVLTPLYMPIEYWPIYLTDWGLILNTIAAGFGLLVSIMAMINLPTDENSHAEGLGLPCYVQAYWAMLNIAAPIAFFISIIYWSLQSSFIQNYEFDLTLDIFIHGVNSVLMFALIVSSRQPVYFYHFYFSICLAIIYLVFTYVYFVLGGINAFGEHAIYPMIDWEKPGQTVGLAALCALGFAILHGIVVAIVICRDALSRRSRRDSTAYDLQETY